MIERVEFVVPPKPQREAWCAWLRWHTIDPCDVLITGFIERDTEARQIRYRACERDEQGKFRYDRVRECAATVTRVVQLESVPSSFPAECVVAV